MKNKKIQFKKENQSKKAINPVALGAIGAVGGAIAGTAAALTLSNKKTRSRIKKAASEIGQRSTAALHEIRKTTKNLAMQQMDKEGQGKRGRSKRTLHKVKSM